MIPEGESHLTLSVRIDVVFLESDVEQLLEVNEFPAGLLGDGRFDHRDDIDGSDRPRRMNRQAFPGVFVQQGKDAKTASVFSLVSHEVPAPNQRVAQLDGHQVLLNLLAAVGDRMSFTSILPILEYPTLLLTIPDIPN
jgi:hypothetical protein